MKYSIFFGLIMIGCSGAGLPEHEVVELTLNRLKNNEIEIDRIKREIKELKLEKLTKNIELINKLEMMHSSLLRLNDSLSIVDKGRASKMANDFAEANLDWVDFNEEPLSINQESSLALMKLQLAILESYKIASHRMRYDWGFEPVKLDSISLLVVPNEFDQADNSVSGEIMVVATVDHKSLGKVVKKMTLNGREILSDNSGWNFTLYPVKESGGELHYIFQSEAILNDTTSWVGGQILKIKK